MACNSLSGTKYSLAQIQQILRQAGWPENLIAKAAALVIYESGGYNRAYNGCGEDSYGWFQIYRRWWPEFEPNYTNGRIFDPLYNSQAGLIAYRRQGWSAWVNSNKKYNRDLDGVATQSQAIYNGNGVANTASVTNNSNVLTNISNSVSSTPQLTGETFGQGFMIVALVGLGALLILGQRQ